MLLEIKDLHVSSEEQEILSNFSLSVRAGEIHAIMGPNGAGKSTLAKVLSGHPAYEVTSGEILFLGEDLLELDPEERSQKGLFVGFQYPPEVAGVTNREFLFHALRARNNEITEKEFEQLLAEKMLQVQMRPQFAERAVNDGFSGGEKKRNEILQMAMLEPICAILDETDSGLDIDALKVIAEGVNQMMSANKALILITHYQRLLDYIKPTFVHVMKDGKIVESGDAKLALKLEKYGYEQFS